MLTLGEIGDLMAGIDNWSLETDSITKEFNFESFKESVDFVNRVAEVSDKLSHHPSIFIDYKTVRLHLTTHEERGLSKNDFELAKEIDKIGK